MSTNMKNPSARHLFETYFKGKPALDDLTKAVYAYHTTVHDKVPDSHSFLTRHSDHDHTPNEDAFKMQRCSWCGLSRLEIRWSEDLTPGCLQRPPVLDIHSTILNEESKYYKLIEDSGAKIRTIFERRFNSNLTAEVLWFFQTSMGYDPDLVSSALDQEIEVLLDDFNVLMASEKTKSGKYQGLNFIS